MSSYKDKIQTIVFPILDIGLNGANYLFHILLSWYLLPKDYGTLNSILAVLSILLVLGNCFQTYTAKAVSKLGVHKINLNYIIKCSVLFYIFFLLIVLMFMPYLLKMLQGSVLEVFMLILIFGINILLSILRGVFQGKKSFFYLNISFYLEVTVKIIAIIALFVYKANVKFVLLSIIFGMVFALIHGLYLNREYLKNKINEKISSKIIKDILGIYAANFFFNFFTSIDMIMINYYLPQKSGVYAVVLKYNQLLTFTSNSIFTVFIPLLTERLFDKKSFNKCVKNLFLIMIAISLTCLVVYKFFMPYTVGLFFSSKYVEAKNYLFLGIVAYIFLNLIFIIIDIYIVIEKTSYLKQLVVAAVGFVFILSVFHKNIYNILYIEIVFYCAVFFLLLIGLNKKISGLSKKE